MKTKILKWPHVVVQLVEALRKVLGSILDYNTGIFLLHNPSGRTMAKWSNQPATEMSPKNIFCDVKAAEV
jgi:hypothetical protein